MQLADIMAMVKSQSMTRGSRNRALEGFIASAEDVMRSIQAWPSDVHNQFLTYDKAKKLEGEIEIFSNRIRSRNRLHETSDQVSQALVHLKGTIRKIFDQTPLAEIDMRDAINHLKNAKQENLRPRAPTFLHMMRS